MMSVVISGFLLVNLCCFDYGIWSREGRGVKLEENLIPHSPNSAVANEYNVYKHVETRTPALGSFSLRTQTCMSREASVSSECRSMQAPMHSYRLI